MCYFSGHVEDPLRIKRIFSMLEECGLVSRCRQLPVSLTLISLFVAHVVEVMKQESIVIYLAVFFYDFLLHV